MCARARVCVCVCMCRPKYVAGVFVLLVNALTIPAHSKSSFNLFTVFFLLKISAARARNVAGTALPFGCGNIVDPNSNSQPL